MTDQLDDRIRYLLATERERAPLPHPWHDIVATTHRRSHRRGRTLAIAAAAIVTIGLLALVMTVVWRGGDDPVPVTVPPAPTLPTSTVPDAPDDPLAGLGETDWVVPSELPDGVRRSWTEVGLDGVSRTQRFFTDDDRDESPGTSVTVGTGAAVDPPVELIDIDGIVWTRVTALGDESGTRFAIQRIAGGHVVTVSGWAGDADLLIELAAHLVVVPEEELGVGVVDPNGTFTEVASIMVGNSRFALEVTGGRGRYCTLVTESGSTVSGACNGFVTDTSPLFNSATEFRTDETITAGYAMPDVVNFEIIARDGSRIRVETVEADGFDDRFWLLALRTSVDLRSPTITIEITRDDGSTDVLAKGEFGRWLIVSSDG